MRSRATAQRVTTLVFGTRLTNITRPLARPRRRRGAGPRGRKRCPTGPAARASARACTSSTSAGRGACSGRTPCVLLVTDGLERDDAEDRSARKWSACTARAARLVWLNPLLRYEGFEPRASGIASMLPTSTPSCPCTTSILGSRAQLAAALALAFRPGSSRGAPDPWSSPDKAACDRRDHAWRALNDPERCARPHPRVRIDREAADNDEYRVVLAGRSDPSGRNSAASCVLEDVVAPERYTLRFEGEGGAAGFAKGTAQVTLTAEGESTVARLHVHAQIGGRIAQIGSRLIDSGGARSSPTISSRPSRPTWAGVRT